MNKRIFLKKIAFGIVVGASLVSSVVSAQDSKESKLRRSGSTGSVKLIDLRAVVRNGLLTVQATLENDSSRTTPINYRFKWLDDSKMKVTDDLNWNPVNLFGGQTIDIVGVAPTPMATDFIIELNGSN